MPSIVRVECSRIEKTQQHKQPVYTLLLHWSDGSVTEAQKSHLALIDLRATVKKNYSGRRDAHVPEVPSMKRFEIGAKKDEKRKKTVEEFFMQLLRLPELADKVHPALEFFSLPLFEDDGAYSNADMLVFDSKELAKKGHASQEKGMNSTEKEKPKINAGDGIESQSNGKTARIQQHKNNTQTTADVGFLYAEVNKPMPTTVTALRVNTGISYIEVDIQNPGDKVCLSSNLSVSKADTLYAEVETSKPESTTKCSDEQKQRPGPSQVHQSLHSPADSRQNASAAAKSRLQPDIITEISEDFRSKYLLHTSDDNEENEKDYSRHQYQNFQVISPKVVSCSNRQFYLVTQSFIPGTACSQYLAVENGDIVEVQAFSGDQVFCTLCASQFRPLEGWLPRNILKRCPSDVVHEQSAVLPSAKQKSSPLHIDLPHQETSTAMLASVHAMSSVTKLLAVTDYNGQADGVLSFETGAVAELINQDDGGWWFVKLGSLRGWVPAQCWQILEEGKGSSLPMKTKLAEAPYFVGTVSRNESEQVLLKNGQELSFIVRESSNLVGQFALSVKHSDHVHHFPIVLTEDNKYYIGKHHFKTIDSVIFYYQRNDLFVDEDGSAVRLRNPLIWPTMKQLQ